MGLCIEKIGLNKERAVIRSGIMMVVLRLNFGGNR